MRNSINNSMRATVLNQYFNRLKPTVMSKAVYSRALEGEVIQPQESKDYDTIQTDEHGRKFEQTKNGRIYQ